MELAVLAPTEETAADYKDAYKNAAYIYGALLQESNLTDNYTVIEEAEVKLREVIERSKENTTGLCLFGR